MCRYKRICNKRGEMYFYTIILCFSLLLLFLPVFEFIQTNYEVLTVSKALEERVEQCTTVLSVSKYDELKDTNTGIAINGEYIENLESGVFSGIGFKKEGDNWVNSRGTIINNIVYVYNYSDGISITLSYSINMPYKVLGVKLKNIYYNRKVSVQLYREL